MPRWNRLLEALPSSTLVVGEPVLAMATFVKLLTAPSFGCKFGKLKIAM